MNPAIESRDLETPSVDGQILRGRCWSSANPRGTLVIAHGLGEHGGSYDWFARELVSALGIAVVAFDLRGSGRSNGPRGYVRDYDDLRIDLEVALRWTAREFEGMPHFLMGHSNGGLVALLSVLNSDLGLAGLILSNPSIRIQAIVPVWKLWTAEILNRVAPWVTLKTGLDTSQLTQDPARQALIENDPLRHDRISAPLFFGMQAAGPDVLARAGQIKLPVLLLLGEADPVIDPKVGHQFFDRIGSPDKTLGAYPAMKHEPINEIGRDQVVGDLVEWFSGRLS